MVSHLYVSVLITGMIVTGSSNSLWSKWQDMQCVENCNDPDITKHLLYEQPVWQTLQMFMGEMLCFLPVFYAWLQNRHKSAPVQLFSEDDRIPSKPLLEDLSGWSVLWLWLPAACDLTGTTLMNIGLLYTPVSIYQMTRGALVMFVGILSVLFLKRKLWLYQWLSLVTVMAGISLVGFTGSLIKDSMKENTSLVNAIRALPKKLADLPPPEPAKNPQLTGVLLGVFFVLFAQVFSAAQFVIEEKIMSRYSVTPLVAVGYEGLFGAITILLVTPILALSSTNPYFDLVRGWHQMIDTPSVLWSGIAIAISIAFFNYFGLSVTRHVSATVRSLVDQCRTLSIWIVSLGLGWEKFLFPISLLQVLGFTLLVYGTFVFNNLLKPPPFLRPPPSTTTTHEEDEALLAETAALPVDLGQAGFDVLPEGEHAPTTTTSA